MQRSARSRQRNPLPRGLEPQPALLDLGRRLRADRCDRVRPRRSLHCVRPSRCRTGRRRIGRARVFHLHQCRSRRRTRDQSGNFGEVGTANRRSDPSAHPTVDRGAGADAYLLHAAAHFDVAGRRAPEIPRATVDATIAEYPRTGFTDEFAQSMRREVELRPHSRAATLWRSGMALPLRTNPLDWKSR